MRAALDRDRTFGQVLSTRGAGQRSSWWINWRDPVEDLAYLAGLEAAFRGSTFETLRPVQCLHGGSCVPASSPDVAADVVSF